MNPMRLSTAEVRDVSPAGRRAPGGIGRARIAIASESKQAGGVSRWPPALKSYYPRPHTRSSSTRHLSVRRYDDGPGRA